ncbi:MAG: protein kinase [Verrucomicrobia bacterium]|nr:protein kinase [Verrucomicrobiota bacterium]
MNTSQANPAMPNGNTCPQCGAALPAGALAGLCPACLLKQGAAADTALPPGAAPFTPPSVADLAKLFPQLEILSLVGQGGMGAVYKARQKHLDRIVALKILPPAVSHDPKFAERFTREARALAKLNHPNIVTLYEFGQADGLFYFLMEFMDGMNLRQLLNAGRVTPKEALAFVPPICDALQFAHDRGIVHRDIKPENILLSKGGQVKIADFGVAKIVASEPATTAAGGAVAPLPAQTDGGLVMGTPQYMAPEQTEHPSEVDHRADIYSLGVVFYQMLTGELPKGKFEPPSKKVVIDVRLDEVVLRALEKEPSRRYQQVSEVKTQVETIATTPPSPGASAQTAPASAPAAGQTWQSPTMGWGHFIGYLFGITFTSPLAFKCANLSALGFLGSLGCFGYVSPEWQGCFGFFGLAGLFGLIGVAFMIEMAARSKRGEPSARQFVVVGRRGGKAVVNWPGVLLSFVLMLAIMEVATIVASSALEERINTNAMLVTFFSALMITGIRIRRGQTMPVDQLMSLDTPVFGVPASSRLAQQAANPLPLLQFWQALEDEDYARAWGLAAPYFQRDVGKDEWMARMEKNRRPLGKAVRREQFPFCWLNVGIRHETRCKTTFGNERTAMETVVAALQPNGEWRIESYRLDLIDAVPATPPAPSAVSVPASTGPEPRPPQGGTPTAGAAAQPAVATGEVWRRLHWPDVLLFCGTLGLAVLGVNLAIALMLWLLTEEPWPMFQPRELPWVFGLMAVCVLMRIAALKLGASDAARPAAAPAAKVSTARKIVGALLVMVMAAVMAVGVTVLTWAWTRTISATGLVDSYSVADMARIAVWIAIAIVVGWLILRHVWRAPGKPRLSLVVQREGQRVIHWPVVRIALLRIGVILAVLWFVQAGAFIIAVLTLLLLLKLAFSLIRGWTMPLDQLSGWRPEAVASAQHRGPRLFWGILVGVAVALAVRTWVVVPYYAASDVVAPEIPQQSYVWVSKLARTYSPGDIVVYRAGSKAMLGRVAQAGPANGTLQVGRGNVPPQSVPVSSVVGKVIFNTRVAAPLPAHPRVPPTPNAFPTISSVVVHHRRVVIEGCGSTGARFVIGVGKGHLSCFLKDSPFTATIERPMWGRGFNCTIKDPRGNVLFTAGGNSVGPMTEQQGRIVFCEGTLSSEPDGAYVIGEFRPDSGLPSPITVRVEKPSATKTLANAKLEVLRVQLRQAREALLLSEARFKTGTLAFPEFQAAKDKVELLEAEITGDPVQVARVRLAAAQRQLQHAEALFKGGVMAAPDYQAAKNAVELRQAELRVAEVEASQTGMPAAIPAGATSSQTNSPPAIIVGSYDFRKSDAYRKLSAEDREKLEQVTRDFMLLWTSLERFADEHDGQLPDTLDQLVPQYFSELPADPFATAKTAQEGAAGYQKSKSGWGYRYRKGAPGNRAWIVASAGLPNFPYLAEKGNVGLGLCKGIWLSGKNFVSVKVVQKPIAQDAQSQTTPMPAPSQAAPEVLWSQQQTEQSMAYKIMVLVAGATALVIIVLSVWFGKKGDKPQRMGRLALCLCLGGLILPAMLIAMGVAPQTPPAISLWLGVIGITSLCELAAIVLGIIGWKSGAGKTAVIVAAVLPFLVGPGSLVASCVFGVVAGLKDGRARVEQRNRVYLERIEAVLRVETPKKLEGFHVRCDHLKVVVAQDWTRADIILTNPQELRSVGGSNVWVNIKGTLNARPVGDGHWEVTGNEQLGNVRFTVKWPENLKPSPVPQASADLPEIESVVVSADKAVVKQRNFNGEGMIFTFGTMTNRWTPGYLYLDTLFDVTIERGWFVRGVNWVVKSRHGIYASYRLDGPPGPMLGKIVFRPGTPAPEADGSYVIGEFNSETGQPLPIAVRLERESKQTASRAEAKPLPRLQFRLVADASDTAPTDTLADPGNNQPLHVRREILLDESAVARASVVVSPERGVSVEVDFNEAGGKRFAQITGANIGKRLAVIFNGKVLSAPTVMSVIRDKAVIAGQFTAAEAKAIVDALNASKGGKPSPAVQRRSVDKPVRDFPDTADLSTPETACAAWQRAVTRADAEALSDLSGLALRRDEVERSLCGLEKRDPNGMAVYQKAVADSRIVEVLTWRDDLASVITYLPLPPGKDRHPFSGRTFGRIDGEWKNLGEDRFPTADDTREAFARHADAAWKQLEKIRNERAKTPEDEPSMLEKQELAAFSVPPDERFHLVRSRHTWIGNDGEPLAYNEYDKQCSVIPAAYTVVLSRPGEGFSDFYGARTLSRWQSREDVSMDHPASEPLVNIVLPGAIDLPAYQLLWQPSVQQALKLSPEQRTRLQEISARYWPARRQIAGKELADTETAEYKDLAAQAVKARSGLVRPTSMGDKLPFSKELIVKLERQWSDTRREIEAVFKSEQLRALKELTFRTFAFGSGVMFEPGVLQRLGVPQDQQDQLSVLERQFRKEKQHRLRAMVRGKVQKMMAVLTPQQQAELRRQYSSDKNPEASCASFPYPMLPSRLPDSGAAEELGLTATQRQRVRKIVNAHRTTLGEFQMQEQKLAPGDEKGFQAIAGKRRQEKADLRKQIEAALTPQQWVAFKEIAFENQVVSSLRGALRDGSVHGLIELTEPQCAALRAIETEYFDQPQQIYCEMTDKALAAFTPAQQEKLRAEVDRLGW